MAALVMAEQSGPSTPASGSGVWFFDNTSSLPFYKDDSGRYYGTTFNAATAAQGAGFASDTFLTNSDILIPSFGLQAKTNFLWTISASKTGAGVAQPVYTIRTGSTRSTSDTSRLALTGPAQTAVADIGTLYILATVRNVGAAAVLQGTAWWVHRGTAANTTTSGTGFANDTTGHIEGSSASFDTSGIGGNYISLTLNGGASAAWTVTQVLSQATW
jgi:hypothetical protein